MKYLAATLLASLVSSAVAAPSATQLGSRAVEKRTIEKRQSMNEWSAKKPNCKSAIFFFARGSTEMGNVGAIIGPGVFSSLKMKYPDIAIQGVEYGAGLMTNVLPGGAEYAGINKAKELFNAAATACPKSMLVGGGYSQGAALMHRAIESLPQATKDRIAAVVLYGDTQNLQDGGKIKNFPKEKVKIFCNASDGVCGGMLLVNLGHLSYTSDYSKGADFIVQKLKAGIPSGGGGGESSEEAPKAAKGAKGGKGKGGAR